MLIEKFHKNNVIFWRSDVSGLFIQCFFSSCNNKNIYLLDVINLVTAFKKKAKQKVEF